MVSIHSEEEHQFVVGLHGGAGFPWLGGRMDHFAFAWSDGTPWDYTHWAEGPVDEDTGDCVHIFEYMHLFNGVRGPWYSGLCSHLRTFVCKKGN